MAHHMKTLRVWGEYALAPILVLSFDHTIFELYHLKWQLRQNGYIILYYVMLLYFISTLPAFRYG